MFIDFKTLYSLKYFFGLSEGKIRGEINRFYLEKITVTYTVTK
jgi:hypothetical protein